MEQRLKERLIGAAILVALAVWLIPWVLDGRAPPADDGGPVPLQLPAPKAKAPERTQTINLAGPSQQSTVVAANEAGAPAGGDASPAPPDQAATATGGTAPQKHHSAPQSTPSSASSSARQAPPAQSAAAPQWVVQLGSFGEQDNAQRLAKRVASVGFDANISTHRSDGQVLYRVRIGPKPSRNAAEAVASALSAHGFVAQVVTAD